MKEKVIIKLNNDREYEVIKKIEFNKKEYVYLVDKDDYRTYIIAEVKNDDYCIVDNSKLLSKLVLELYKTNNYKE